ncbi:unnamed protein product [Cunninghamella blakesleeana]
MAPTVLVSNIVLPEVERQLVSDRSLWPNIKGFFVVSVTKRRRPATTWYILLQGNEVQPIITNNAKKVQDITKKRKIKTVKIRVEDSDLLNFVTGGLTGIKAYTNRRIKVRGDLALAQSLESLFEKAGGRERALDYIQKNKESLIQASVKAKL